MIDRERIVIVPPVMNQAFWVECANGLSGIFIANSLFSRAITTKSDAEQCGVSTRDFIALYRSGLLRRVKK